MDQNLCPPPEKPGAFRLTASAGGARWQAQLYVTLLFWRRTHHGSPGLASGDGRDSQRPPAARRNLSASAGAGARLPDDPWDHPAQARPRFRSCLIMAALLLIAWASADTAARLFSRINFERLLTGG